MQRPQQFQFRLRHLLLLVLGCAVLSWALVMVVANINCQYADVKLTGLTDEPDRIQVKFEVRHANGYTWSATPAPPTIPIADLRALEGMQFRIRYRTGQVLWMKPEVPVALARLRVKSILRELADERGGVENKN